MALPITIPNSAFLVPVNLSSSWKTFNLPVASSFSGRMLVFKDLYGNANVSSIRLSTIGLDTIENTSAKSLALSNAYGAWWLANDGVSKWFILDAYLNSLYLVPRFVFNVTTFSAANFNTGGNATFVGNEARITTNSTSLAGSMYYNQKVNIQTFTTNFTMRFEQTEADGGTFVIQNSSSNAVGSVGFGLGYQGIGTSVAIRLDTYNGAGVPAGLGQFSTDILTNGSIPTDQAASGNLTSAFGLTPNTTWTFNVRATYNGSILSYTVTNAANGSNFSSNASINIPSIVGANTAWVGFTGGTGGRGELQFISSWNYDN